MGKVCLNIMQHHLKVQTIRLYSSCKREQNIKKLILFIVFLRFMAQTVVTSKIEEGPLLKQALIKPTQLLDLRFTDMLKIRIISLELQRIY